MCFWLQILLDQKFCVSANFRKWYTTNCVADIMFLVVYHHQRWAVLTNCPMSGRASPILAQKSYLDKRYSFCVMFVRCSFTASCKKSFEYFDLLNSLTSIHDYSFWVCKAKCINILGRRNEYTKKVCSWPILAHRYIGQKTASMHIQGNKKIFQNNIAVQF